MTAGQFPQAFIKREQAHLGTQWDEFEEAHLQPSPVSIRYNPAKGLLMGGSPVPWTNHGRYLNQRPNFTLDPSFHGGKYYVQEASSMFLEQAFQQHVPANVSLTALDLCAAPGGKSTHILSMMDRQSLLVSNEVIQSRAAIVTENIKKWGHCNVVVTNNDAKDFQRLEGFFDVIVVDAPCSGEGLFRKDKAALNEWSEEAVDLCSLRQRRILSDVWPALKPGGILIYSTCTYSTKENEDNLNWLEKDRGVEFLPVKCDPAWGIQESQVGSVIGYRCFPHRVKGEGFFLSVMRKNDSARPKESRVKSKFQLPPKNISNALHDWLLASDDKFFIVHSERVQFFPAARTSEIQLLVNNLRVVFAGTAMVSIKRDKLIPDHALSLSIDLNRDFFDTIPLDENSSLQYLKKETIPFTSGKKGFALITFENICLGWVNILDNRINNLYPSEWRIRIR